ncbi:hypothetical protein HYQ44_005648 [Verticillium longisporum]|nr:hypothetical protein HYQ44_005648 [Verticillium longisporum]
MSFLRSRGLRTTLVSLALTTSGGAGACFVGLQQWTKPTYFEAFDFKSHPVLHHLSLEPLRLAQRPQFGDSCVREVAFQDIEPGLLQDGLSGGTALLEQFAGGVFGRYAFRIQRNLMKKFRKSDANSTDLWEEEQISHSDFKIGTIIADDFIVRDKSPTSIMLQGGTSPRYSPDEPHEMDTIITLRVNLNRERQLAEFRLECIVAANGITTDDRPALGTVEIFLHQCYSKLLLTAGSDSCIS